MEKARGKPPFLAGLGGFRALAALAVLTGHALSWLTPLPQYPFLAIPAARLTQAGLSGFFVLSGFVLFYTHAPRPDAPAFSAKRFTFSRDVAVSTSTVSSPPCARSIARFVSSTGCGQESPLASTFVFSLISGTP